MVPVAPCSSWDTRTVAAWDDGNPSASLEHGELDLLQALEPAQAAGCLEDIVEVDARGPHAIPQGFAVGNHDKGKAVDGLIEAAETAEEKGEEHVEQDQRTDHEESPM